MEPLQIHSRDGAKSDARLFLAGEGAPGLLVLPAMGVNARAYDRLGQALAARGLTTLVSEHRGGDTSSVRAKRGVDYGYAELLDDMELQLAELKKRAVGPLNILGHSLGGQLATAGLARWFEPGGKLIVIASGTVHHRAWGGLRGFGLLASTQLAHVVARGLGYFPGHRLGFGGLQGRSLIVDWANAARTGEFRSHVHGALEHQLDTLAPEVKQRLTADCDTPARRATSSEVACAFIVRSSRRRPSTRCRSPSPKHRWPRTPPRP